MVAGERRRDREIKACRQQSQGSQFTEEDMWVESQSNHLPPPTQSFSIVHMRPEYKVSTPKKILDLFQLKMVR